MNKVQEQILDYMNFFTDNEWVSIREIVDWSGLTYKQVYYNIRFLYLIEILDLRYRDDGSKQYRLI